MAFLWPSAARETIVCLAAGCISAQGHFLLTLYLDFCYSGCGCGHDQPCQEAVKILRRFKLVEGKIFTSKLNYLFIMPIEAHYGWRHHSVTNPGEVFFSYRRKKGEEVAYSKNTILTSVCVCLTHTLFSRDRDLYLVAEYSVTATMKTV